MYSAGTVTLVISDTVIVCVTYLLTYYTAKFAGGNVVRQRLC